MRTKLTWILALALLLTAPIAAQMWEGDVITLEAPIYTHRQVEPMSNEEAQEYLVALARTLPGDMMNYGPSAKAENAPLVVAAPKESAFELWLGAGAVVIPGMGNAAYNTSHQEAQFSAGFFCQTGSRLAFNFSLATDTVKMQRWAVEHQFSDGPAAEWSRRYYALDAEAHYLLTPTGSKCQVSTFLGGTLYRSGDTEWGGFKGGLLCRYALGKHLTAGAELAVRHAGAGPFGDYTVGELVLRVGWRF